MFPRNNFSQCYMNYLQHFVLDMLLSYRCQKQIYPPNLTHMANIWWTYMEDVCTYVQNVLETNMPTKLAIYAIYKNIWGTYMAEVHVFKCHIWSHWHKPCNTEHCALISHILLNKYGCHTGNTAYTITVNRWHGYNGNIWHSQISQCAYMGRHKNIYRWVPLKPYSG